jgi:trans-aconitate 2-methyltransferase
MWDPGKYRQFGAERSRPFYELVSRVGAAEPRLVADLGCGPGELTAELCTRWPAAQVVGVDNSAEMIAAAGEVAAGLPSGTRARLRFELADVTDWEPPAGALDVIVSNAMLQWLPEHEKLLSRWVGHLAPGGWLAFAVPGNFDQPTHGLIRELAASPRWREALSGVAFNRQAADPAEYLDLLAREGCTVDAWETTYFHVLDGEDAVLRWYQGTGLRPVIAALDEETEAEFMATYGARLRERYPRQPYGTVLPFRRVFVVARRSW